MDAVPTISAPSGLPRALARLWSLVVDAARAVKIGRREHSLRVCETLSLGDRRFLAVVQLGKQRFLIGSTSQSISLLQRLDEGTVSSLGIENPETDNAFRNGTR